VSKISHKCVSDQSSALDPAGELTSFPLSWIWGAEEETRVKGIGRRGKEGEKGNRGEGKFPLYQHLFFYATADEADA